MISRRAFPSLLLLVAFVAIFSQVKPVLFSPESVELGKTQNENRPMPLKDLVAQGKSVQSAPEARTARLEDLRKRAGREELQNKLNRASPSRGADTRTAHHSSNNSPFGDKNPPQNDYVTPQKDNDTLQLAQGIASVYNNHTSQYCLSDACIQEIARPLARAFPDRPNLEDWCVPRSIQHYNTTTNRKHRGLILVKVPKAASTTAAAVVLRLGHRHDCDMGFVHWSHQHAHKEYARRAPTKSFMLMSVRDPAKQLVSHVFWSFVTLRNIPSEEVTDELLTRRVMNFGTSLGKTSHFQGGLQTQFAALEKIPRGAAWNEESTDIVNKQDILARAMAIVDGYDFILVVERMDESLVALALLLNVPVGDVLVTSSKVSAPSGGTSSQGDRLSYVYSYRMGKCLPMRPAFYPPLLKGYLESDYFKSRAYGDSILHAAASQSLDLTIERLGVKRFQDALKEYRYWKQKEKVECASRVAFPCSSDAVPQLEKAEQNCYNRDLGCGYQCVDEMLASGETEPK